MTHNIIQVRNFFGSFFFNVLHVVIDLEQMTFVVFEVNFQFFLSPTTGFWFAAFDHTLFVKCSNICHSSWPLLSVLLNFTNWPVRFCPLFFTFSINRWKEPRQNLFFFQKNTWRLPPSCFLFSDESSTVSWLFHDLLLRMSLTLAKESGISAFCHGLP